MELKDTIQNMISDDYKDRFLAEYQQLVIRKQKLDNLLHDYWTGKLDFELETPPNILAMQSDAMGEYLKILASRAWIEGITILPCTWKKPPVEYIDEDE